jgi:probable phosphoglycerate mutase
MTLFLLRHAEKTAGSFFDPRLRHQDPPITPAGQMAAEAVAAYLAAQPLSAVYVSGYTRTRQTAEPIAQPRGLDLIVDERLNEFDIGVVEPMSEAEVQQSYPDVWTAFTNRASDFRWPGGETGAEAQQRIRSFLEERRCEHSLNQRDDAHIVAVCHEGLIRLLMCSIAGLPPFKRGNFHVDYCGIMEVAYQPKWASWKLMRFNHTYYP